MATTVVNPGTPGTPAAPATPPPAAAPTAADLAALKSELEASRAAAAEHERTAKFWYDRASKGGNPRTEEKPAPAEAEEDVLDTITSKGEKGLDALLRKRGFVTRAELDATVNEKAATIASETQLLDDFPDLRKKDSEFFKATALAWGELKDEGVPEGSRSRLAAERAELRGIRAGTIKTPAQRTEEARAQRESDRAARAAAGAGERGARAASEEADDELTPEQRTAAIRMIGGDGVTDEQAIERYKARAKKGVVMRNK